MAIDQSIIINLHKPVERREALDSEAASDVLVLGSIDLGDVHGGFLGCESGSSLNVLGSEFLAVSTTSVSISSALTTRERRTQQADVRILQPLHRS